MFQKATKEKSKLRLAIFGVAGAGKTLSALRIANGIAGEKGRIAVIDSEAGSANKYGQSKNGKWKFDFDICTLEKVSIENYIHAINNAKEYDVLIIDSLSHAWQELLQENELLAQTKFKGNTWSAWSQGTPRQKTLINAIIWFPGHIIATMRSKTEWTISVTGNGKTFPRRDGLAPEQGKGIEYEFDLLISLTDKHYAEVIKDRTGKYQDKIIEMPDEMFGAELSEWLSDGIDATQILDNYINKIKLTNTFNELFTIYNAASKHTSIVNSEQLLQQLKNCCKEKRDLLTTKEEK